MGKAKGHGMPEIEIPNVQVKDKADEFRRAANVLYGPPPLEGCVSPLLMAASFGVELYLKSLNAAWEYHEEEGLGDAPVYRMTSRAMRQGHPLLALYDAIAEPVRLHLGGETAKRPLRGRPTLRAAIEPFDTLFVDARYSYEEGKRREGVEVTRLVELLNWLGDSIGEMPRWAADEA